MKSVFALLVSMCVSVSVNAYEYECVDLSNVHSSSNLQVDGGQIHWSQTYRSISSDGELRGLEAAPHEEWYGYGLFELKQLIRSEDSSYILALSPELLRGEKTGEAVLYFDNGDHAEEVETYECFAGSQNVGASLLQLDGRVLKNSSMPFISHQGAGEFATALAMNVQYEPIKDLKQQIEKHLGRKLRIFTGWNPNGEAHVTTITPPEYSRILRHYVSAERIDEIAQEHRIQDSDLKAIGIGKGEAKVDGKFHQTYFLIVQSENLLNIRRAIHREFVSAGGQADSWSPEAFYPHITIAFTKRDLHEADGVIKDSEHSLDSAFVLRVR